MMFENEAQQEAWDTVAQHIDFNLEINLSEFQSLVPKDAAILDYGCGYGRLCDTLTSVGYQNIVGLDSSSKMIERGRQKYPHLSLQQNNGFTLNYPDENFGAILLCAVLTCVPNHQAKIDILTEIYRLLKPGGVLHLVEFCSKAEKIFESGLGVIMNHQQTSELKKLLNPFTEVQSDITQTQTMTGNKATAFHYFGKKPLEHNKQFEQQ